MRSSVRRRLFDFAHPCLWGERTIQCSLVLRRTDFEHNETPFQRVAADPNAADPRPSNAADPTMPPTQRDAAERRRPQCRRPSEMPQNAADPNAADPNAADPAHGPRRGGAMGIQGYRPCTVGIPCRERATPT